MRIHAEDLAAGDTLLLHDWRLHIVEVVYDTAVGVLTAEFGFLLHFPPREVVEVRRRAAAA